jgi:hypothetical protein
MKRIIAVATVAIALSFAFPTAAVAKDHPKVFSGAILEHMKILDAADQEVQRMTDMRRIFGYVPASGEIDLLKRTCMAEGGNTEPIEGLERIFEVVANRCRSERFPNTIEGVLCQKNQFQTVAEGIIWRYTVNDRVEKAWKNFLKRGRCKDREILFFTAEGYNPYCVPAYKLGNHYFGR